MAKGPQGWVQCEDRLACYTGSSCSLLLLLSMVLPCVFKQKRGSHFFSAVVVVAVEVCKKSLK
jgi:hypothetical protein